MKLTPMLIRFTLVLPIALAVIPLKAASQATPRAAPTPRFVVTTPQGTIRLTCEAGCAWRELTFSASPTDQPVAVDELGMASADRPSEIERSNVSRFLFTIRRTEDGVQLQGLEGFAWTRLSYTCPTNTCSQAIDQHGMTR